MENSKAANKKDSWLKVLLSYTDGSGRRLIRYLFYAVLLHLPGN